VWDSWAVHVQQSTQSTDALQTYFTRLAEWHPPWGNICGAGKTHRELFSEFYADLLRQPLEAALAADPRPAASLRLFERMMADIMSGSGASDPVEQVYDVSVLIVLIVV
jgi:hypothetical protein